jgi:hypothetical protein
MHTIIIFRLALFSYCLLFNEERLLVERTRNYVHSAKRIVSANNNSVGYFVPLVKLYVVKIESAIETLKKGKKALRYALGEFDTKKIKRMIYIGYICKNWNSLED